MIGTDVMKQKLSKGFWGSVLFTLTILATSQSAYAHCDTLDGPVVKDARVALDKGDITPLFKWLRPTDEKVVKGAFDMTLDVRAKGGKAKGLVDMYFFETLVRIHREGEGAPYTGLKLGVAVDPAVALADKALENGSIDKLVNVLTNAMAKGISDRFKHTIEKQKHADDSVAAGREFVESYVTFTHYVEGLHGIVNQLDEIIEKGILSTPAIIIDDAIKSSGQIISVEQINGLLVVFVKQSGPI